MVAVHGDADERFVQERSDRILGDYALDQSAAGMSGQAAALDKQALVGLTSQGPAGTQVRMPGNGPAIVEIWVAAQGCAPKEFVERILAAYGSRFNFIKVPRCRARI